MSLELLNLCHSVLDAADADGADIAAAKEKIEVLHEEGTFAKMAAEIAHEGMGDLAVQLLGNIGIPFVGGALLKVAQEAFESKVEAAVETAVTEVVEKVEEVATEVVTETAATEVPPTTETANDAAQ